MDSVLNLLFEKWENGNPLPNGNQYGCTFPYCSEYIQTNNLSIDKLNSTDVYYPVSLNSDFNCIFRKGFFSQSILSLLHNKKIKVLLLREHEGGGDHKEFFKKLYQLITDNNLYTESFYIHFANKNIFKYYTESIGEVGMNLHITDWLLEHTSLQLNRAVHNNKVNELGYKFEKRTFEDVVRKFNFLCFNRIPKAHRVSFISKLIKDDVIDKVDWSMLFAPNQFLPFYGETKHNGENVFDLQHFSFYFDRKELYDIEKELKYVFYTKKKTIFEPESEHIFEYFGDTKTTHYKQSYDNSYCSLVTETSFENNEEHLSEKSFKPFINLHLGIFLAPYKHLERLRGYGFKTFGDIWDESYDDIVSPKERFNKVCELIKNLNETNNLKDLYLKSKDILEYNQRLAFDFWKRDTCTEYFKKLANEITAI
jgi:hypothetical protein